MDEKLLLLLAGGLAGALGTLATQAISARFKRREQLVELREAWAGETLQLWHNIWRRAEMSATQVSVPLALQLRDRAGTQAMYHWVFGRMLIRWQDSARHQELMSSHQATGYFDKTVWRDYNRSARFAARTEAILIAWSQGDLRWPALRLKLLTSWDQSRAIRQAAKAAPK